jgi:long-subunit acyl-CoA synthetase (AMP-forming)
MKLSDLPLACRRHATRKLIEAGTQQNKEISFGELIEHAERLQRQLAAQGLLPGQVVAIAAANSIGWIIWDLALLLHGAIVKALPSDIDIASIEGYVEEHDLALFVSDRVSLVGQPFCAAVDVLTGPIEQLAPPRVSAAPIGTPDVHSLVYSSGTTGRLKGLIMSRSGTELFIRRFLESFELDGENLHIIFLPLFSYQQRLTLYGCLTIGCDIVLTPFQRAFHALPAFKPTFLIAPPVFYDTLLQLHKAQPTNIPLAAMLGGRLKFCISGMAPISRKTLDAYWNGGVQLLQVYGMNECGMICWNTPLHNRIGTVGRTIEASEVTLAADGEVLVRCAAPLALGYFDSSEEDAAATFLPGGTIATGDYGARDADGFLTLLGRKKDIIVLRNGQKFHPAEVEAVLGTVAGVREAIIVTDQIGSQITAVVVPDDDAALDPKRLHAAVLQQNDLLKPHQRFASVIVHGTPITSDSRFLTKNLKLNRRAIFEQIVAAAPPN